jgi:hypothetical protein
MTGSGGTWSSSVPQCLMHTISLGATDGYDGHDRRQTSVVESDLLARGTFLAS